MTADQPPHPDAGSDDRDDSGQPQIVVDDPEDFAQTRQLRAIFDARDDYVEQRQEANRAHEQEGLDWTRMNRHIFRYLQDFAMAVEPLLLSHEKGKEIWTEREYSIESNFVDKSELASLEDAKAHMRQLAENFVEHPVTTSQLRKLLKSVGETVPEKRLKQIAEQINQNTQPDRDPNAQSVTFDGGQSPNIRIQQNTDSNSQMSRGVDATGVQTDRPASRVNLARLQSSIQQQAAESDVKSSQVDISRLVDSLFRYVGQRSQGMVARNPGKEKFRHQVRCVSTDWGWSTEGVQSLVGAVPKLAYSRKGKTEFGTTAPPQWLSNDVFRDLQKFVDDVGLGIQFDDEQQTKIDDNLLQEVDSWRQKNVK